MTEMRHNLRITGTGGSEGGQFRDVKVVGDAHFDDDIDCLAFRVTGTASVYGNLKCTSCAVSGTLDVEKDLETGQAKVSGNLTIGGNLKVQELKSFGETKVSGSVAGENVQLEGGFNIKGNCEAEQLNVKGVFRIGGLVNAETVSLALHSRCEVKEIGGERIDIRRADGNMLKKLFGSLFLPADFYEGTLAAESIEGDDIYIEHTKVRVVRGANVTIGPGCTVERVEYTGRFENRFGSDVAEWEQL
jgi:cytoskeletal protein CcmA (bactofilin family)